MKKTILTTLLLVVAVLIVIAQGTAEIKFEKTTHNFGAFSENNPKVTCKFKFTNTGNGSAGNSSSYRIMRMYSTTISQRTNQGCESGEITGYLQREPENFPVISASRLHYVPMPNKRWYVFTSKVI